MSLLSKYIGVNIFMTSSTYSLAYSYRLVKNVSLIHFGNFKVL